eukprot:g23783.t1
MVSELKAAQVEELSTLRTTQLEDFDPQELANMEVQWTAQVSDLKSYHAEEIRSLRHNIEETTRRSQRMLLERDDAREQLLARQREGARVQQQCADARHEVLELSVQVRSSTPYTATPARHLSRSLSVQRSLQLPYALTMNPFGRLELCHLLEQMGRKTASTLRHGAADLQRSVKRVPLDLTWKIRKRFCIQRTQIGCL